MARILYGELAKKGFIKEDKWIQDRISEFYPSMFTSEFHFLLLVKCTHNLHQE